MNATAVPGAGNHRATARPSAAPATSINPSGVAPAANAASSIARIPAQLVAAMPQI